MLPLSSMPWKFRAWSGSQPWSLRVLMTAFFSTFSLMVPLRMSSITSGVSGSTSMKILLCLLGDLDIIGPARERMVSL